MSKPFRLAVVNSHPIQYFAPLYAYLDKDPGIEVTALYCSDFSIRGGVDPGFGQQVKWDVELLEGYRYKFMGERAGARVPAGFWSLVCPELWGEIRGSDYDAVLVHGYSFFANLVAVLAAKTSGKNVLMRSETHLRLRRSPVKTWLRDRLLSVAYRWIDGFLAIGSANREYYESLGVPASRLFLVPYTVDNDRFTRSAETAALQRDATRTELGLPLDKPVVLYASKFMARKHPDDVVRAMAVLRQRGVEAALLMIGTGEMADQLRELAASLDVEVVFGGFVNQGRLPWVYSASDVFVLPAESEAWGLVVNEVMCSAVPVLVSEEVGCVPDLVEHGVNGFHTRARDVDSIVAGLEALLKDQARRVQMGEASRRIIGGWSYEQCREGVLACIAAMQAGKCETERAAC